jgi:hypothetical protein
MTSDSSVCTKVYRGGLDCLSIALVSRKDEVSCEVEYEIEVMYRLWVMAITRPEWFRNARATRIKLDDTRKTLVLLNRI